MRGWYKEENNHALLTVRITIEQIAAEWVALYQRVPPLPRGRPFRYRWNI